ncbi:hypothetical protein LCGC14_1944630 [marine sediment metagenome]|uniref:DNA 5'-3' helicase n=1 Tax=marine sediment metagenome TaxID=412755 RepID=A0A0F9FJJ3_9ZZZZ
MKNMEQTTTNLADIEAEQACLALLLINNDACDIIMSMLMHQMFADNKHKLIFEAASKIFKDGNTPDRTTIIRELKNNGKFHEVGVEYMVQIGNYFPPIEATENIATIVRDFYIRREKVDVMHKSISELHQYNTDIDETSRKCIEQLAETSTKGTENHWTLDAMHDYELWYSQQNESNAYPTWAFSALRSILGPLLGSEFIVVAAIPGGGKTTFLLQNAMDQARLGFSVLFCSIEMGISQLAERVVRFDLMRQPRGRCDPLSFSECLGQWRERPIELRNVQSLAHIENVIRWSVTHNGVRVVYVDYLQIVSTEVKKGESYAERVGMISKRLAMLAKQLKINIIAASQFNREGSKSGKPTLFDLRGSGEIEQDADRVLLLYSKESKQNDYDGIRTCEIAKNRYGRAGSINLLWVDTLGMFTDMDENNF